MILNEFQRYGISGDLIEEKANGTIYIGTFKNGADENGTKNCIIKKVQLVRDLDSGATYYSQLYAEGVNYEFRFTWAERENYSYQYAKSK